MTDGAWLITSLPNLHPAVVHFPLALLPAALATDLAGLAFRRWRWIDPAAALLYVLGTAGAGAAYLAGRSAADGLGAIPPAAEAILAAHSDRALLTLVVFGILASARAAISWRDARHGTSVFLPLRFAVATGAVAGLWLLLGTADLGGALVYRQGVAVRTAPVAPGSGSASRAAAAPAEPPFGGASVTDRLVRPDEGGLLWRPLSGDAAALGTVLRPAKSAPEGAVRPALPAGEGQGLALEVAGRSLLVLPGSLGDAEVSARLDLGRFEGTIGLAHHVRSFHEAMVFEVSTTGEARLIALGPAGASELGRGNVQLPAAIVTLSVSSARSHQKGFVDGRLVAHGHLRPPPSGAVGLLLDGQGTVLIESVRATPL